MPSVAMHSFSTRLFVAAFGVAEPLGAIVETNPDWTSIGEIISINGMALQHSVTRVTHLNSDARAHEKVPGMLDAGQLTFKANYFDSNQLGLLAILPGGGGSNFNDAALPASPSWGRFQWLLQFPTRAQWYATGFMVGFPAEVPEDDRITLEVTVELSGRPSFFS